MTWTSDFLKRQQAKEYLRMKRARQRKKAREYQLKKCNTQILKTDYKKIKVKEKDYQRFITSGGSTSGGVMSDEYQAKLQKKIDKQDRVLW